MSENLDVAAMTADLPAEPAQRLRELVEHFACAAAEGRAPLWLPPLGRGGQYESQVIGTVLTVRSVAAAPNAWYWIWRNDFPKQVLTWRCSPPAAGETCSPTSRRRVSGCA